MNLNQTKRLALALFIFLALFVPKTQACGCLYIEQEFYLECPIILLLFFALPLYFFVKFIAWFVCDAKSYGPFCENLTRVLNCSILAYYNFAAIFFIRELLPIRYRFSLAICTIFFNPLILTFVACAALRYSRWANHLFGDFFWAIVFPFAIAFITTAFDGSRYAGWDLARTAGLAIFSLLLFTTWFSLPESLRPFWSKSAAKAAKAAKPVYGLHLDKPIFNSAKATCGLCGEAIGEDYVTCSDCCTPLHKECWEWNGRTCVVYGCMSRTVKPKRLIKALGRRRGAKLALATC